MRISPVALLVLTGAVASAEAPHVIEGTDYSITYDIGGRCTNAIANVVPPAHVWCQDNALLWRQDELQWYKSINRTWVPIGFVPGFPLRAPNGTKLVPSYSFSNDTDTGMFLDIPGAVDIAVDGQVALALLGSSIDGGLLLGGVDVAGTPVVNTFAGTDRVAGVTNGIGGNVFVRAGASTGDAEGGSLSLAVVPPGTSGTAQNPGVTFLSAVSNSIVLGGVDIIGTPGATVVAGVDRVAGVTDGSGGTVSIRAGQGTGTGNGGLVDIEVSPPGSGSGSAQNSPQVAAIWTNAEWAIGGWNLPSGAAGQGALKGQEPTTGRTDTDGGAIRIQGGRSTGTGLGGLINMQVTPPASGSGSGLNSYQDAFNILASDGSISFGGLDVVGAPATSTWSGADRAAGVTDGAGGNVVIDSGVGTGAAAATTTSFRTPTVGGSGSSQQTLATRLTVATAGITATVPVTSSFATSLGWSVVAGADTACNTTCTNACVFGWNLTAGNITGTLLACTDATADACLCAGAN